MGTKTSRWSHRLRKRLHNAFVRDNIDKSDNIAPVNPSNSSEMRSPAVRLSPIEKARLKLERVTSDFETNYTSFLRRNQAIRAIDSQLNNIIETSEDQANISRAAQEFHEKINALLELEGQKEEAYKYTVKGKVAAVLNGLYTITRVSLRVTSVAAKVASLPVLANSSS